MSIRNLLPSRGRRCFLLCFILTSCFQGCILSEEVILNSIQIFTTHGWLTSKPIVYFQCKGENKTVLPDVSTPDVLYSFRGEESFQPLTELRGTKCKRCGFYEQHLIKTDDPYDEWEFCPSDFTTEGKYTRVKEKELNATFLRRGLSQLSADPNADSGSLKKGKGMHLALLIAAIAAAFAVVILIAVAGYYSRYAQRKKGQTQQGKFRKSF